MDYIVIPDVHADMNRLIATMTAAHFSPYKDGFRSETGRKALFLGDLIDNGPQNKDVIRAVRSMVEDGEAMCLMGNHELNAVMMHMGHRARSDKNIAQHAAFLREFRFGDTDTRDVINWFATLPLRVQIDEMRIAHAFWGNDGVLSPLTRRDASMTITHLDLRLLPDLEAQSAGIASEILDVTKGPEIQLPPGDFGFSDHYGKWRTEGRMKWWGGVPDTWEDALTSLHNERRLPEGRPDSEIVNRAYPLQNPLLLIGHYKMRGEVKPVAPNVVCLDFPHETLFAEVDSLTGTFKIKTTDCMPEPAF